MMAAAVVSSLRVFRTLDASRSSGVCALGGHQRHHADAGFESGEPQDQQRKGNQSRAHDVRDTAA